MSTADVADFIADTSFESIPPQVLCQAKKAIRDLIGVMVASHEDRAVKAARELATNWGGREESTVIGVQKKVPCQVAAFVNTVMASTLDMDDGSMGLPGHERFHRGHPGCMVIPSALALAEKQNSNGKEFLTAVVIGYEVALATAWSFGESVLAGRTGTYGSAAVAAKLMGLSKKEIASTLCIAEAHCPSPTYSFIWNKTHMTKEAPAWAAMTGVTAALLAAAGFRGAPTIFDMASSNQRPVELLGKEWEILGLYFKPYSSCRVGHSAIDGVLDLIKEHGIEANAVQKVTIGCSSDKGIKMSNYRPSNIWQAQYSLPFVIGAAILEGEVGPRQITEERLSAQKILGHGDKVTMVPDSEVQCLLPGHFSARVEIESIGKQRFQTFRKYPKGEPENPMNEEELVAKFKGLVSERLLSCNADDLMCDIDQIEEAGSMHDVVGRIERLNEA